MKQMQLIDMAKFGTKFGDILQVWYRGAGILDS